MRASGTGQGPAKGVGTANIKKPLEITTELQSARAKTGWLKRKLRNYSHANPEARVNEQAPSRVDIAALAQQGMPESLMALELIIHRSRSDVARVAAFNAFRQVAYGPDRQAFKVDVDFSNLTDAELRAAIAIELGLAVNQISEGELTSG